MSPRPYRLGQRQAAVEQTRARILAAARELLMSRDGFAHFSIEGVARQADVARMTIYYQFNSRVGLLEALCDSLAANGGMAQLAAAFRCAEPLDALKEYIRVFCRFWESDRLVTRRLRGLAMLDSDFEQVIRARDERRREGLRVLVARLSEKYQRPLPETREKVVAVLFTLTGFEFFDTLANAASTTEEVASTLYQLAQAALNLDGQ